jgi:hypothetical protein
LKNWRAISTWVTSRLSVTAFTEVAPMSKRASGVARTIWAVAEAALASVRQLTARVRAGSPAKVTTIRSGQDEAVCQGGRTGP